jgi:hypothetical protein
MKSQRLAVHSKQLPLCSTNMLAITCSCDQLTNAGLRHDSASDAISCQLSWCRSSETADVAVGCKWEVAILTASGWPAKRLRYTFLSPEQARTTPCGAVESQWLLML